MKNLKNKILLLLLMAMVINACHKEENALGAEYPISEDETLDKQAIFFSNEKTSKLLSATARDWNPNQVNHRSEETLNEVKAFIQNFDAELSDQYVSHIINTAGYPFWDARYEIQVENVP